MKEFANLLRCSVGMNLIQVCRVGGFHSYLRLFNQHENMINQLPSTEVSESVGGPDLTQVISTEHSTVTVAIDGTSQESDNIDAGVVIPIPTPIEREDLNFSSQVLPDLNFSSQVLPDLNFSSQVLPDLKTTLTENKGLSPTSDQEPQSNSTHYDSITYDEFFHVATGHSLFQGNCQTIAAHCGLLWNILDSPYSIPFWLLLMSAPVSASVIGSLHMHSCPGATHLSILIFCMGLLYSIAFLLKICSILLKVLDVVESCKPSFKSLFGTIAVLTIGLSVTESAYFWQMHSSQEPGSSKYCDPQLISYAFWWNCFIWFGVVILCFCQV